MSFDEVFAAAPEEEPEVSEGRPVTRRVTLPEIRIKAPPTAPLTELEYETDERNPANEGLGEHSALLDLAETGAGRIPAARRTARRLELAVEDPETALFGTSHGATMGLDDEFWGALTARPEVHAGSSGSRAGIATESRPARTYREGQQEAETASEDARESNPAAFGVGEAVGAVGAGAALAPLEGAQAASVGGRLAQGALAGELYGAASGLGNSEHTIDEDPYALLNDTAAGGLEGVALGTAFSAGGEVVRGAGRQLGRLAEGADLARVASVAPGRTISRTDPTIAEFASHPGGIEGQAERLRRMAIVSPAATSRDVFERAGSEYERVGEDVLGPIRSRVAEAGPVPTRTVHAPMERVGPEEHGSRGFVDSLAEYADELARSPDATDRSFAPQVREQAEAMLDAWGDRVPYADAEAQLRRMGQRTQWVSPSTGQAVRPPTEIRQEVYRRMRGALDDIAESRVGPDEVGRFREGRLDAQTARTARDLAEARMGRDAQGSGIGLVDTGLATAAGSMGAGPLGSAAVAGAGRAYRSRSGALRATGLDLVRSMVESGAARNLGAYGPILERALQRGVPAFTAAHRTLMRDAEYRRAVAEAEQAPESSEGDAAFAEMFDSLTPEEASP